MCVLFNLKFLSCMTILLTIYSQETTGDADATGPGESACNIVSSYFCDNKAIPTDQFPSCTSFIFSSLCINEKHKITYCYDGSNQGYIDTLGTSGKKLYVSIGRDNYTDWSNMLDCDGKNAEEDAKAIYAITSGMSTIKGLLLRGLEPSAKDSVKSVGFTESVMKYIEAVKQKTALEIGLTFAADDFLAYYDKPPMDWLNFTIIDSSVDFYVLSLISLANECSGESAGRSDGVISIDGDYTYTLEKLKGAIDKSQIPIKKVYYNIPLSPQSMDDKICQENYQTVCECPDIAKKWCTDTQETLFKKGQWFHQNGGGFIGNFIDADDPHNVCQCGNFPTFNAILAGLNGTASVPACPLKDRSG